MIDWQGPVRKSERLDAVQRSGLAGLTPRHAFDRLIEIAVELTGAPRGVIALVDSERTTAFSAAGFPEGLPLYTRRSTIHSVDLSWRPAGRSSWRTRSMIQGPSVIQPSRRSVLLPGSGFPFGILMAWC